MMEEDIKGSKSKQKEHGYRRWYFWIPVVLVVLVVIIVSVWFVVRNGSADSDSDSGLVENVESSEQQVESDTETEPDYFFDDVYNMVMIFKGSVPIAKDAYEGKYLEVRGNSIALDASGKFVDLGFTSLDSSVPIRFYIQNEEQLNQIKSLNPDAPSYSIRGYCTSVNEESGYSLNMTSGVVY